MSVETAFKNLQQIIADVPDLRSRVPAEALRPESRFREDLGFDSLLMMSFYCELEERFPGMEESMMASWRTLADCAQTVAAL